MKVGDTVAYFPVVGHKEYSVNTVVHLYPEGIPSCPEPLVKLNGVPGVVLQSHCLTAVESDGDRIASWLEGLSRRKDCAPERRYWYEGVAADIRQGVWKLT